MGINTYGVPSPETVKARINSMMTKNITNTLSLLGSHLNSTTELPTQKTLNGYLSANEIKRICELMLAMGWKVTTRLNSDPRDNDNSVTYFVKPINAVSKDLNSNDSVHLGGVVI